MSRKKLFSQIGNASAIIGLSFGFQAISDIFIARHVTASDYGYFTLIFRDSANILSMLLLLGMDTSLIRSISNNGLARFDWRTLLKESALFFLLVSAILSSVVAIIYHVQLRDHILLIFVASLLPILSLGATILRIHGNIAKAQINLNLWRFFFALSLLPLFWLHAFTIENLVMLFFLGFIFAAIALVTTLRNIPHGKEQLSRKTLLVEGILFFGLSSSSLMMAKIERFFIGGLRTLADVGAYYAISLAVVTAFTIAASGSSYVMLPHFAQGGTIKVKKNLSLLILIGIIIASPFAIGGKEIIHLLFMGKYDTFSYLIPFFIGIGMLQLLYFLPSSYIGGKADKKTLQQFLLWGFLSLLLNVVLCLLLIPRYGLSGAAASTLTAWIIRLASGLWFTKRILNQQSEFYHSITSS